MTAVQAFGQTQDGRQRPDGPPPLSLEVPIAIMAALGSGLTMVPGDERDGFNLIRFKSAQVAVLDEVVRMLVVTFVADVYADVV
jgi:hypothetical protein